MCAKKSKTEVCTFLYLREKAPGKGKPELNEIDGLWGWWGLKWSGEGMGRPRRDKLKFP